MAKLSLGAAIKAANENGAYLSRDKFAAEIEAGRYSFARMTGQGQSGRKDYAIESEGFYKWLETGVDESQQSPSLLERYFSDPDNQAFLMAFFADPINSAHFSKWCAKTTGGINK